MNIKERERERDVKKKERMRNAKTKQNDQEEENLYKDADSCRTNVQMDLERVLAVVLAAAVVAEEEIEKVESE